MANHQHNSELFDTAQQATASCLYDFFTACGCNTLKEALSEIENVESMFTVDMTDGEKAEVIKSDLEGYGWYVPKTADEQDIVNGFNDAKDQIKEEICND